MINRELIDFLCEETTFEDIGNERLLHNFPMFGQTVGQAINCGNLLNVSIELANLLEKMDLYKACLLSNFIGFACEKENNTSAGQKVLKLFIKACNYVYGMLKSCEVKEECMLPSDFSYLYQQNKEWVKAYYGFETICITAMAFLTRDTALRKYLKDLELEEKIIYLTEETPKSPYLKSVYYINRMYHTCADLKLLVLQPEHQQGFYATANDLDNCFHLIFLLEEQIAERFAKKFGMTDFKIDAAMAELAHGAYPVDCQITSYSTYFTECNYGAALQDAEICNLIWGEMPPEDIPKIADYAIIVLKKAMFHRSFDISFLVTGHTALKPGVKIEKELTVEEYHMWMNRIKENV